VDKIHDGIPIVAATVWFVILCQGADDLRIKGEVEMRSGISTMQFRHNRVPSLRRCESQHATLPY